MTSKTRPIKVRKYTNITNGDTLYAVVPPEETEINGEQYLVMSYTQDMRRTFLYKKSAVRVSQQ